MCGIIGNINRDKFIENNDLNYFLSLSDLLKKRGPDSNGYFLDEGKKIFMGHLRLSIVDLSNNAGQPMQSENERYVISFNGEIYNFLELGIKITTNDNNKLRSDTRVLIEYLSKYGLEKTLQDINGMFAISIYDKELNKLYLARDFFGKKPIYYHFSEKIFFFSSTLNPIIQNKNIKKKINFDTTNYYFNYGFYPDGFSVFENINKVKKNTCLVLDLNKWKINMFEIYKKNKTKFNDKNVSVSHLENLIFQAVEKRLITDVPTCVLLSSGIDSAIVSYFASLKNRNIETYTVGFEDKSYDESNDSKKIARYIGLKNETIYLKNNELKHIIEEINEAFDEPFADSSQIPSMLIFKNISNYAKVCITGDGGDEIFYGYNRYQWYLVWEKFFKKNVLANNTSKVIIQRILNSLENNYLGKKLFKKLNLTNNKTEKFLNIFFEKENIYYKFLKLSFYNDFVKNVKNTFNQNKELDNVSDLRNYDIDNYLVDDILTKVDRSSMFYSVEARSPFLDKKIFDYMNDFSSKKNIGLFNRKILLKKILKGKVPNEILSKPKKGFSIPLERILIENLKKEVFNVYDSVKNDERLNNFNFIIIDEIIHRFFDLKDYKLCYQVWSFYVFFIWFRKNKNFISS